VVTRIDHVVVLASTLSRGVAAFERLGFTVTPGGEHAAGTTHNALVPFVDGSYIEIIAFHHPEQEVAHRWWPKLALGGGVIDFALLTQDVKTEAARLRAHRVAVRGPDDGGRQRPDGAVLKWRSIVVEDSSLGLPFIIEDVTERSLRVPGGAAAQHANGATGIAGTRLVVPDLASTATAFAVLLGESTAAHRFPVGAQWIELGQRTATAPAIAQLENVVLQYTVQGKVEERVLPIAPWDLV
jgi:hypothetical protein